MNSCTESCKTVFPVSIIKGRHETPKPKTRFSYQRRIQNSVKHIKINRYAKMVNGF